MIVRIENLTVRIPLRWGGTVHAATGVSMSLREGSIHALVGESGCGKSTIGQSIVGLLPRSARISGNVLYRGRSVFGQAHRLAGRDIALIPQSAATFLTPVRTVGSQLDETIKVLEGSMDAPGLLKRVGLNTAALDLYPHELSGGMAQRAAIAFALAGHPNVIVADEPTASLDPERTTALFQLLRSIADEGTAIMLITHELSALIDTGIADDLSVIYASRVVEQGQACDLLAGQAKHSYTRDLLAALPRNGLNRMPGMPPELTDLAGDYSYAHRKQLTELALCED